MNDGELRDAVRQHGLGPLIQCNPATMIDNDDIRRHWTAARAAMVVIALHLGMAVRVDTDGVMTIEGEGGMEDGR